MSMAITSMGYNGPISEKQVAAIFGYSTASRYGVVEPGAFAASTIAGQVLQLRIAAGTAWTSGVVDTMTTAGTVQLEGVPSGSRWDMIVLRRDYQPPNGGETKLAVIKGGPTMHLPKRENDPGVLDDQPLWLVKVDKDKSVPSQYVDLRVWARNGGCTANHDLVRSYLNGVGTHIAIGDKEWLYGTGTNNTAVWVELAGAGGKKLLDTATWQPNGNSLVQRHHTGSIQVETGTHPKDAANKAYVDVLKKILDYASYNALANSLALRDKDGALQVASPARANEAANKAYVDYKTNPLTSKTYVDEMVDSLLDVMPKTISGNVTITPKANTPTSVNVTFPVGSGWFRSTPNVVATADSALVGEAVKGVSVDEITRTGFRLWIHRTNTTPTKVYWVAT